MLNIATFLETNANDIPEKIAIHFAGVDISYGELNRKVNIIASALEEVGIGKGDKVALSCLNLPYFPMIYYAILKVGAVVVPLNVLLKADDIAYHLDDSDAKAYFCFEGTKELPMGKEGVAAFERVQGCEMMWMIPSDPHSLESHGKDTLIKLMGSGKPQFDMAACGPDDTAVILYTSGTTGKPKGAELTHSNLSMNAFITRDMFKATESDKHLVVLPLFHSFGQTTQMNSGFLAGTTLVLVPRFDPAAVLKIMEERGITIFAGVPTMFWAMLNYPNVKESFNIEKIRSTLRLCISGGASIPVDVLTGFMEIFDIPVLEGYGLSETSPVVSFNRLGRRVKVGSIGLPIWGVEVSIRDNEGRSLPQGSKGEIVVRGHNVMKGYYGKDKETKEVLGEDGWLHTGDIGMVDEDGYIYIVDRIKDLIIRGGFNIYPREIEETLLKHSQVSMAAVVGVPNDRMGEEVKAYVVLKDGSELSENDLISWSREKMAAYKYPRIIEFRESLPMNATGKILKKELQR